MGVDFEPFALKIRKIGLLFEFYYLGFYQYINLLRVS
jgi:hypothetical protein